MRKKLLLALPVAALLAAGCATHPSGPNPVDVHAKQVCQDLKFGTQMAHAGEMSWLPSEYNTVTAVGWYREPFRVALWSVIRNYGLENPPASAVEALQAQCDKAGVKAEIWPTELTDFS